MQRRNSLGETTKMPRLSTGSTRRLKSRRSQSSVSSISDVFACEPMNEGHGDLSVRGMKLRSENNLDGDEWRNAGAGAASVTPTDPFEEWRQTLIRPDCHHHEGLEGPGDDFEREEIEIPQRTSERSEATAEEELSFKGTSKSEIKSNSRRKEQSSLVKQGKSQGKATKSKNKKEFQDIV